MLIWLPEDAVRRLYGDLAVLVRRGGVVAHSERMPLAEIPRLGRALAEIEQQHTASSDDRRARWDAWWEQASRGTGPSARGDTAALVVFETTYPTEEFSPPASWHTAALRDAGFAGSRPRLAFRFRRRHRRRPLARLSQPTTPQHARRCRAIRRRRLRAPHAHATELAVALDDGQALVLDEMREGARVVEADDAGHELVDAARSRQYRFGT